MYFDEPYYDQEKRYFFGKVDLIKYEISDNFNDHARWDFRMHFSKNFACIEKGSITAFDQEGKEIYIDVRYIVE